MSKTRLSFPKAISPQCHGANNAAVGIVASVLGKVKGGGSIKVITRAGEKKNANGWSWYDPANRQQVMMLTHGGPVNHTIEIATDPKDVTQGWRTDALVHEFVHCHHERTIGSIDHSHDARYRGKVWGWK